MPKSHDSHQGSDAVSQSPSSDAASQLSEANYLGNQRLKHSPSPHPAADRHLQFTGVSYEEFHGRESQPSGLSDV